MSDSSLGRSSYFIPEVRSVLLQNLAAGATIKDACSMAGISDKTYYSWLNIGEAIRDGEAHDRIPDDLVLQQSFVDFVEAVEKAKTAQRLRTVTSIIKAGTERWIHRRTGVIRTTPPPGVTWVNEDTGELMFADPTELDPQGRWTKEWSGQSWNYDGGSWQAHAWWLERRYPEEYGRSIQDVRIDFNQLSDDELEKLARGGK